MSLELQFKIKENESYLRYLRQHDHWYKILNRAPWEFKRFEEERKACGITDDTLSPKLLPSYTHGNPRFEAK